MRLVGRNTWCAGHSVYQGMSCRSAVSHAGGSLGCLWKVRGWTPLEGLGLGAVVFLGDVRGIGGRFFFFAQELQFVCLFSIPTCDKGAPFVLVDEIGPLKVEGSQAYFRGWLPRAPPFVEDNVQDVT